MNIKSSLILSLLSLAGAGLVNAAAPVNDTLAKATTLTGNHRKLTGQSLLQATPQATDPMINGTSAGKTVWYQAFAPARYAKMTLEITCTSGVITPMLYEVMDISNPAGSLYPDSTAQAISAGQKLRLSYVFFDFSERAAALMVAGSGEFSLSFWMADTSAENDFPATAEELTGEQGTVGGNNTTASVSSDEPGTPAGAKEAMNVVWYRWTPTFTGAAAVDTNFSFSEGFAGAADGANVHDTVVNLYSGSSHDNLTPIATNNDGGWQTNSLIFFTAIQGTTYYVSVGTNQKVETGTPGLFVQDMPGAFILNFYRANTAGQIFFTDFNYPAVVESDTTIPITIIRRYSGALAATFKFANAAGGTATANTDYTAFSSTLSFSTPTLGTDNAWLVTPEITVMDDSTDEADFEHLNLALSNPSTGATLTGDNATAYIRDDESPVSISLIAGQETLRMREGRYGYMQILRQGDNLPAEAIHQNANNPNDTAKLLTDFTLDQSAEFSAGDRYASVYVNVVDDDIFEPEKSAIIWVTSGGVSTSYTLIIEDEDPFMPVAGRLVTSISYSGYARTALINASISGSGSVSGKATLGTVTTGFSGVLDLRGRMSVRLSPPGRSSLVLTLEAQDTEGSFKVSLLDGATQRELSVNARLSTFSAKLNPCPLVGAYTCELRGSGTIANMGGLCMKVDTAGNAKITGRLFDGTALTLSGFVDNAGYMNAVLPLYAGQGVFRINGSVPNVPASVSSISFGLNRPARAGDPLKLGALLTGGNGYITRYIPPAAGQSILEAWQTGTGKATLASGPLMNMITKNLSITPTGKVTAPVDANKLTIAIVPGTGAFTGSFISPGKTKPLPIFGVLRDLPAMSGEGNGFFFDGLKGGAITLSKP